MKRGTKIQYKGSEYNEDGDRPVNLDSIPKIKSVKELQSAIDDPDMHFMHISEDKIYGINKLSFKQHKFLLLEPNPVTFYFSLAFDSVNQIEHAKVDLENTLNSIANDDHKAQAFSFVFRVGSVAIIFSFLALEAFLNQMLPDHGLIEYKGKMLSKDKIERFTPFSDKLNLIIPALSGKDFSKVYPNKVDKLESLKALRDKLTHLKEIKSGFTSYNQVYQDVLNTDLKSIVFTVKSFINFYSPELIENYIMTTKIK